MSATFPECGEKKKKNREAGPITAISIRNGRAHPGRGDQCAAGAQVDDGGEPGMASTHCDDRTHIGGGPRVRAVGMRQGGVWT